MEHVGQMAGIKLTLMRNQWIQFGDKHKQSPNAKVDFSTHIIFMPPKMFMRICKVSFLVIFATFIPLPDSRQTLTVISHL